MSSIGLTLIRKTENNFQSKSISLIVNNNEKIYHELYDEKKIDNYIAKQAKSKLKKTEYVEQCWYQEDVLDVILLHEENNFYICSEIKEKIPLSNNFSEKTDKYFDYVDRMLYDLLREDIHLEMNEIQRKKRAHDAALDHLQSWFKHQDDDPVQEHYQLGFSSVDEIRKYFMKRRDDLRRKTLNKQFKKLDRVGMRIFAEQSQLMGY